MHASEKCMVLPVTESYGGVGKWFSHVNQAAFCLLPFSMYFILFKIASKYMCLCVTIYM